MNNRLHKKIIDLERKARMEKKRIVIHCPDDSTADRWHVPGSPGVEVPEAERTLRPGDIRIIIRRIDSMAERGLPKIGETETIIDGPPELIEDHPPSGGRPIFPVASIKDVADFHSIEALDTDREVGPVPDAGAPDMEPPAPVGQLADETGRSPATIRDAIIEGGKKQTVDNPQLSVLACTDKHRPKWFRRQ